jgi:methylmalonyl-CoA/ethylmalonyl-CoA epimerase
VFLLYDVRSVFERQIHGEVYMFRGLDHLAIVVPDTEAALAVWRDRYGFPVLFSENNGNALLTHLDLGNTQLQLVEPIGEEHPLREWLQAHGPGLHHLCLSVDDAGKAMEQLPAHGLAAAQAEPHQGTLGRRALFVDPAGSGGIRVELTGE